MHDAWIAEIAAARRKFEDQNAEYYKIGLGYADAVHPAVIARELVDSLYRGELPKEQTTVASGGYGIARFVRRELRGFRPGQIMNGAHQYGAIGPDLSRVRKGDLSLSVEIRGSNHAYAVKQALNLVNELFLALQERRPEYLIERFGFSTE